MGTGVGAGVGDGVGSGVGLGDSVGGGCVNGIGVGVGVGPGDDPGVGLGGPSVGPGVGPEPAVGLGVGLVATSLAARGATCGRLRAVGPAVGSGAGLIGAEAVPPPSSTTAMSPVDAGGDPSPAIATSGTEAGVSRAPSTAPAGRNGFTPMRTTIEIAMLVSPIAITGRRLGRRRADGLIGAAAATAGFAIRRDDPHPGHAPRSPRQHRSQAWTPQSGHRRRPTCARLATGPMRLPHRSQNGIPGPPEGGSLNSGPCGVALTNTET